MSRGAALALVGVLALSALAWALRPSPRASSAAASVEPGPAGAEEPGSSSRPSLASSSAHEPRVERVAPELDPRAAKQRLLEDTPRGPGVEPDAEIDFDAPRPGPEASVSDPISEREQQLDAQLQVEQAQRLHAAVEQRAQALRARLEQARASGDPQEAERLELMLRRLEQRGQALERTADELAAEG